MLDFLLFIVYSLDFRLTLSVQCALLELTVIHMGASCIGELLSFSVQPAHDALKKKKKKSEGTERIILRHQHRLKCALNVWIPPKVPLLKTVLFHPAVNPELKPDARLS